MNPFLLQQQNVPSVETLWKDEVSKYRLWVVLFFIGALAVFALSLSAIILAGAEMDTGVEKLYQNYKESNTNFNGTLDQVRASYISSYLVLPGVLLLLLTASIALIAITTFQTYKTKNFARMSAFGIIVIQISAFIAFINVFQILFFGVASGAIGAELSIIPGALFTFIVHFLYIPVWVFVNKISGIRKRFLLSERMAKLKNDPNFLAMQQQMQNMQRMGNPGMYGPNPYGPNPNVNPPSNTPPSPAAAPTPTDGKAKPAGTPAPTEKISETDSQLNKLNLLQLRKIAKSLYISGYKTMKRKELIAAIKRVTNS